MENMEDSGQHLDNAPPAPKVWKGRETLKTMAVYNTKDVNGLSVYIQSTKH